MLACQGPEQLDRELRSAVETNTAWTLAFRPSRQAAQRELLPYVDITGAMIDPALPDTTLSTAAERTLWLDRLSSLPPRHGCYLDRSRGQLRLLRTPNVPLDEFRARAAAKPRVMARVHAGAAAVPAHVLIQQMHAAEARKSAVAPAAVPSSSDTPRPSRSKPKKQPPLRLPK